MKKILFYISVLGITGLALIIINFASGAAPTATNTEVNLNYYVKNFCFGGQFNQMDTSDVIKEYLKQTNNFFNKNISYISNLITEGYLTDKKNILRLTNNGYLICDEIIANLLINI